jgi:hypothetical protein
MSGQASFCPNVERPRVLISHEALEEFEKEEREIRAQKAAGEHREREKRAKAYAAKVVDYAAEIGGALTALEDSVVDYQTNKEGKPNMPLISARQKVVELQAQLDEATQALKIEEAKGSWIDQLDAKIREAEQALGQLSRSYADKVADQLTKRSIGDSREFKTAPDEIKSIVKHHERLHALRKFTLAGRPPLPQRLTPEGKIVDDKPTLEFLYKRAVEVAETLSELRLHIAAEERSRD